MGASGEEQVSRGLFPERETKERIQGRTHEWRLAERWLNFLGTEMLQIQNNYF